MPASANATMAWPDGKLGPCAGTCRSIASGSVVPGRPRYTISFSTSFSTTNLSGYTRSAAIASRHLRITAAIAATMKGTNATPAYWTPTIGVSSASGSSLIVRNTDCSAEDTTPSRTRMVQSTTTPSEITPVMLQVFTETRDASSIIGTPRGLGDAPG